LGGGFIHSPPPRFFCKPTLQLYDLEILRKAQELDFFTTKKFNFLKKKKHIVKKLFQRKRVKKEEEATMTSLFFYKVVRTNRKIRTTRGATLLLATTTATDRIRPAGTHGTDVRPR